MALLFTLPRVSTIDLVGELAPRAKLYFYATGTTTPQAVYSDSALTVPMTQPVVASDAGLFQAIYLNDALGAYKVVCTDENDQELWSVDPYLTGPSASVIGSILNPRTAAELAADVPITNYVRDPGDIRRYGGSTSGTSVDNATAITAAIAQAMQALGSPVLIADGDYATDALTISNYTGNGLEVIGRNGSLTVGANVTAITVTGCRNVTISGLTIKSSAASGLSQRGVYIVGSGRIRVTQCTFPNLTYGVYVGASATGIATGAFPIPSYITNNVIYACGAGVYTAPSAEYVTIGHNIVTDCTLFGVTVDSGNVHVIGNTISGCDVGAQFDGSASSNGDHGSFIGNICNHNAKANLVIKSLNYSMIVSGNNLWAAISTNYSTAPYDTSYGALLISASGVTMTGNVFGNSKTNLGLDTSSNNVIMNNVFHADSTNTVYNIRDIDGSSVIANAMGRNAFKGTLVASANNNDTEQIYAPTFANSWVNFGSTFRDAGYWRDAAGVVHILGTVKSGTIDTVMFTLPAGFRPSETLLFSVPSNAAFGYVEVQGDGDVICKVGDNTFVGLDGISFKAE